MPGLVVSRSTRTKWTFADDPLPGGRVHAVVDAAGVVWDAVFDSDENGRYPNGGWTPRVRRPDGVARLLRWQDLLERHGPVTEYGTAVWEQANLLVAAWIEASATDGDEQPPAAEAARAVLRLLTYTAAVGRGIPVVDVDPRDVLTELGDPGDRYELRVAARLREGLASAHHPAEAIDALGWALEWLEDPLVPEMQAWQAVHRGAPLARRVAAAVLAGAPVLLASDAADTAA